MLVSIQAGARPLVDVYIPGPQGPKGDKGTAWLSGAGIPAPGTGIVQDWYLNTLNGDVYEKTGLTTWTLRDNITGPAATNDAQTWVKAHRWEPDSNFVPITVKANVSQTADLQQWQTNAGVNVVRIASDGHFYPKYLSIGTPLGGTAQITAHGSAATALIVKAATSQTANLQEWHSSAGTILANINSSGAIQARSGGVLRWSILGTNIYGYASDGSSQRVHINTDDGAAYRMLLQPNVGTTAVQILRGAPGTQTANLTEWQNGAGTVLSRVDASGYIYEGANRVYSAGNPISNMVSTDTVQTIVGVKTFTGLNSFTSEQKFSAGTYADPDNGVARAIKVGAGGIAVLGGTKTDNLNVNRIFQVSLSGSENNRVETFIERRTLPTTNNDTVDLGTYNGLGDGAGTFSIDVVAHVSGVSLSKTYVVPVVYDSVASWRTVMPTQDGGAYSGNNFALEIYVNQAATSFRLRRTGGSVASIIATAAITVLRDAGSWTPSSTVTVAAPATSGYHETSSTGATDLFVSSSSTGTVATRIKALSGQTADLLQLQNSSGTVIGSVESGGRVRFGDRVGVGASNGSLIGLAIVSAAAHQAADTPFIARGFSGQTADLQQWQNSAGTKLSYVAADGTVAAPYGHFGPAGSTGAMLRATVDVASRVGVLVRAAASQTGNLQEWQDSSGAVLSSVSPSGAFYVGSSRVLTEADMGASGSGVVTLDTAQTITGLKTFTNSLTLQGVDSATLTINADTDNVGEDGVAKIRLTQDGNLTWFETGIGADNFPYFDNNSYEYYFRIGGATKATIGNNGVNTLAGTAALPAFSFLSDSDTGILNPAANILAFSTAGVERLRVESSGNLSGFGIDNLSAELRANNSVTGGGTLSLSGSTELRWTARMIVISNGKGAHFGSVGYFDITMPPDGTVVTGVGGATNVTVTAGGIPLPAWSSLYYILPIGASSASVPGNFRLVNYTADAVVPPEWVLIAKNNQDNLTVLVNTQGGITLKAGQSYNTSIKTAQDDLLVHTTAAESIAGAKTFTQGVSITGVASAGGHAGDSLTIVSNSPQIQFIDQDYTAGAAGRRWWFHVNNGTFYILRDADDNNAWDSPHAFYIASSGGVNMDRSASIVASSAASTALVTKAFASQTADIQQWQNSAGTSVASVAASGSISTTANIYASASFVGGTGFLAGYTNVTSTNGASNVGTMVRGVAGQTGDLQQWQDSTGTVLSRVNNQGWLVETFPGVVLTTGAGTADYGFLTPLATRAWFDRTRFTVPTWETSANGTTFTSLAHQPHLLSGRTETTTNIPSGGAIRAQWSGMSWSEISALFLGFSYIAVGNSVRVLVEYSNDNVTWRTGFDKSGLSASTVGQYIRPTAFISGDQYLRLTIFATTSDGTTAVRLNSIQFLSTRMGDQGGGVQNDVPYSWNGMKTVVFQGVDETIVPIISRGRGGQTGDLQQWQDSAGTTLSRISATGQIFEGANRVYSAGNPPPATDLSNYVTLNSAQTISAVKTFTAIPVVPDSSFTIAKISATGTRSASTFLRGDGTFAAVDLSAYVTIAGPQTISGTKTFSVPPVVPNSSFGIPTISGLQAALDSKYSSSNAVPVQFIAASGTRSATTYLRGDGTWSAIPYVALSGDQTVTGTKIFSSLSASATPLIARGVASQTADIMQFQDSSGAVLARVANDGTIYKGNQAVGGNAADTEIMAIMGAF